MDAILNRTGAAPVPQIPQPRAVRGIGRALRALSAVAYVIAERLTLPQRDVPPEFYRFPPL